jgi:ribonuclease HII
LSLSIACASIIAKVARDRLMLEFDQLYPGYGFANHKGYGTKQHLSCLQQLGASPIHRHSFAPVRELCKLI